MDYFLNSSVGYIFSIETKTEEKTEKLNKIDKIYANKERVSEPHTRSLFSLF